VSTDARLNALEEALGGLRQQVAVIESALFVLGRERAAIRAGRSRATVAFADPASMHIRQRRRRLEASGLRMVMGSAK
jgi:hypothetical protein